MADVERTIQIIFGAQDATGQVFQSVGSNLTSLSDSAESLTQPLADITDTLLTTSAGIAALGAAALGFAINEGRKFEDALIELGKVLSDDEGDAEQFTGRIIDLSNEFGIGATEVAESAARFKQAGFDIEESFGLVRVSLTAAAASELDAVRASDLLVRGLKGLGEATIPAASLLDKFNAVQNNFNTSVGNIAEGFADLAPLISNTGFSIDETIGLLTPIIEVFGSGSEAARGLRTAFLRLGTETKTVVEELFNLGISTRDSEGNLKSVRDIFFELADALEGASKEQRLATAAVIAGKDNAAKFAVVLENVDTVTRATNVSSNSLGSSLKELEAALGSLTTKAAQAQVAFQNFAIQFGQQLLPQSKEVVDSLGEIGKALSESLDAGSLDALIFAIQDRFQDLSQLFSGIADALPEALAGVDFTPIIEGFDEISDALSGLFGGVDLTSVQGLQSAIQFVIDTIGSLEQVVGGIITAFGPFISGIASLVNEFNELDDETKASTGEILGFGKAINSIAPAFSTLGTGFSAIGAGLTTIGAANLIKITADITKAAGSAGTLGATLTVAAKALGPLSAALATGLGVGALADQIPFVRDFADSLIGPRGVEEAARLAAESSSQLESQVSRLRDRTGDLTIDTNNYFEKLDEYIRLQGQAQTATSDFGDSVQKAGETLSNVTLAGEFTTGGGFGGFTGTEIFKGTLDQLDEVQSKIVETGDVAKATDIAPSLSPEKVADLNLALDKLTQQERIARIQAFVDVNTANAQLAATRIEAAFTSVNTAVESTGDTLLGLFDIAAREFESINANLREGFGGEGLGAFDQSELTDAIRNEVENRQKALELARELQETEVEIAKLRAQRLSRGISEITINADGVEPALRTILLTILQEIQIQASADGAEFLLGIS